MAKICIIQRRLTHYRVPLFAELQKLLAERDIQLDLLVGHGSPDELKKQDAGTLPWAKTIPTHYLARGRLCWQPMGRHLKGADMVIVTQENKLLQNHLLMVGPRNYKLAFWGHGANLQSDNPNGIKERFKRWTTNQVDWWFAYTEKSADLVDAAGFPRKRITILNNAVDTSEMRLQMQSIKPDETFAVRESLGFGSGPVGIFVGSFYADKRLDFLFAAAEAIRHEIADFQLLIVGEGAERDKVQAWCEKNNWAKWVGSRFGREKIVYLSLAHIMLNPGALGLGIMDAFIGNAPMITVDSPNHGPEISYLINDVNAVITKDDLKSYIDACVELLRNPETVGNLRAGCSASALEYTVENMAHRFAEGIQMALSEGGGYVGLSEQYDNFYKTDLIKEDLVEVRLHGWPKNRVEAIIFLCDRGDSVLDIGCGNGQLLYQLRNRFSKLVGLEYSAHRLEQAKLNLSDDSFVPVHGSAEEMSEVASESIDCIVSADTIEHIPDVYPAATEMFRVLCPGGKLVINTPNIAFAKKRMLLLMGRFPSTSQPNEGLGSDILFDGGHLHYFTFRSLRLLLERAGFVVEQAIGFGKLGRLHNIHPPLTSGGVQLVARKPA